MAQPTPPTPPAPAVHAEGLTKRYGAVRALDGLDLHAEPGTVLALLGPNGAGKTTAVRTLTTLTAPDTGWARIHGLDTVARGDEVRARIGLTGQYATVDELLTGRENLEMFARLHGMTATAARGRAEDLLTEFDLTDAADRGAATYSGGMRRRLDLAVSLLREPDVLFLDEPTTGLDPRSRMGVWESVAELVRGGTTVLLTTQYLEEADRLADRVTVIDHGRAVADGTPDDLRARVGGLRLDVAVHDPADLGRAAELLGGALGAAPTVDTRGLRVGVPVTDRVQALFRAARALEDMGPRIADLDVRRPSLDEVFLSLTGHATAPAETDGTTVGATR
ncbi:ATP-binding cassette domain-containing protein [Nocardiopsis sp. HNM0947]|uniref:ATP-binding cassette domain-containing protein n=1 Tax=Nocardiopsis coralli TaxID=2772213 RepID=A0ABR9P1J1_9ACTN|nr:ATP-binding cassette domain-containing protein [Nocardiopsis coralli]MBE2997620.1 ATP-binding cassette domain-containing protein [Nocardiopsis coralli]